MLLTITTSHEPASDLGYLLAKNPANVQAFELSFGKGHVFYPVANAQQCTMALLLDIDPIELVRGKSREQGGSVEQYVNDRPYVASSYLSVAIAQIFRSAMNGISKERQALADTPIELEATVDVVPAREGAEILHRLFEPLGYEVTTRGTPMDDKFVEWGESPYFHLHLKKTCLLRELLTHLYVLIPVLDNDKHYAVGDEEVEKLLQRGEGWLNQHPERNLITNRYLRHKKRLTKIVWDRLTQLDVEEVDDAEHVHAAEEAQLEERISLNQQRINSVIAVLKAASASTVIDLGCGQGTLLRALMEHKEFAKMTGMDVSYSALETAKLRLKLDQMPDRQRQRLELIHGSLTYRDARLSGFDAATCIEVVEHLDPYRLAAFERVLFEFAQPKLVVLTTPNIEYNKKFESLPAGKLRHRDHRFEWTRAEFESWSRSVAERHGYAVRFLPVGDFDTELGAPTQMGVFTR